MIFGSLMPMCTDYRNSGAISRIVNKLLGTLHPHTYNLHT